MAFGLFKKGKLLHEKANMLVKDAKTNSVTMYMPFLNKFSVLREVDVEHWDFILTVAGVFIAANRLNNLRLGNRREEKLMEIIAEDLDKWDSDGIPAFEHCKKFFASECERLAAAGYDPQFLTIDVIGAWITLNLLGRPPRIDEEYKLIRPVGLMVTQAFFSYWET